MGRAARVKKQRHTTRIWHTRNPWTSKHETFPVCISDEALREWELNRVRLANAGYPDRPPEFDSPHYRAWNLSEPGRSLRPKDIEGAHTTLGVDPTATVLGTWHSGTADWGLKINVGRRVDGTIVHHVVVQHGETQHDAASTAPDEAAARAQIDDASADLVAEGLPPLFWVSADEFLAELSDAA